MSKETDSPLAVVQLDRILSGAVWRATLSVRRAMWYSHVVDTNLARLWLRPTRLLNGFPRDKTGSWRLSAHGRRQRPAKGEDANAVPKYNHGNWRAGVRGI